MKVLWRKVRVQSGNGVSLTELLCFPFAGQENGVEAPSCWRFKTPLFPFGVTDSKWSPP